MLKKNEYIDLLREGNRAAKALESDRRFKTLLVLKILLQLRQALKIYSTGAKLRSTNIDSLPPHSSMLCRR